MKCAYRSALDCRFPDEFMLMVEGINSNCLLCLAGQQIDSIELLTSAVMNLGMDKLEKEASNERRKREALD